MIKGRNYIALGWTTLIINAIILFLLVRGDQSEKEFYSRTYVVPLTQWLMLVFGLISFYFSTVGIYTILMIEQPIKAAIKTALALPCLFLSCLLLYGALLFLVWV